MKIFKILALFLALGVAMALIWWSLPPTRIDPATSQIPVAPSVGDTVIFDPGTGLVEDTNLNLVIANCTACHSAKLIQQHRFSREGWTGKIRWMQKNHNLWDLGASEASVLDYLEKYYSPKSEGNRLRARRAPLKDIEWYKL